MKDSNTPKFAHMQKVRVRSTGEVGFVKFSPVCKDGKDLYSVGPTPDESFENSRLVPETDLEPTTQPVPLFSPGKRVRVIASGEIGVILDKPTWIGENWVYSVDLGARGEQKFSESDLEELGKSDAIGNLRAGRFTDFPRFLATLINYKIGADLSDNMYSIFSSRTIFYPYQFKPVFKLLHSANQRILIADEVGLGKTIEAGIILTELQARHGELSRVLIVCPAHLCTKWGEEMRRRFNQDFKILKAEDLKIFFDRLLKLEEPILRGICSLQLLRRARWINALQETQAQFDLVIVDEAHYMKNAETLSFELGEMLSRVADVVVMLSATPIQLGTTDLFNLLNILEPEVFQDAYIFDSLIEPNPFINLAIRSLPNAKKALEYLESAVQTSQRERLLKNPYYHELRSLLSNNDRLEVRDKIEAQRLLTELNPLSHVYTRSKRRDTETKFPVREARVVRVTFTDEEKNFYKAVTDYVSRKYQSSPTGFTVMMPQRQVASCIQAFRLKLLREIRSVDNGGGSPPSQESNDEETEQAPEDLAEEGDDLLAQVLLKNQRELVREIREHLNSIGDRVDTKFDRFLDALRSLENEAPGSKIVVFAFFKGTLNYLHDKLNATNEYRGRVRIVHGDVPLDKREAAISEFRDDPDVRILLSSEVGAEGIDLQFANVVFNYDLPWNPMRVEQRIGRLDRMGQPHEKVLIYNFSIEETIDDIILQRLYNRINIFEQYLGDLEAILGDQINKLTKEMFNPNLSDEQKRKVADKIAENIVRNSIDFQEFEKKRQTLVGHDDFFKGEMERVLGNKKYITSDELFFLVEWFLKERHPESKLLPDQLKGVFSLSISPSLNRFLFDYAREFYRKRKLALGDGSVLLTFSSQVANEQPKIEFINMQHPLVQAIKKYYEEENILPPGLATSMSLDLGGDDHGDFAFFIYRVEKSAIRRDISLVPVLVRLSDMKAEASSERANTLLANFVEGKGCPELQTTPRESILAAEKHATELIESAKQEIAEKLRLSNDAFINNQIESLRQSTDLKIQKASQTLNVHLASGKGQGHPIVKLYEGKIRNLKQNLDLKITDLEKKRKVVVSYNCIACGLVRFNPRGEQRLQALSREGNPGGDA